MSNYDTIDDVIEVELNGKRFMVDLADVSAKLLIDPNHLDEELQRQAGEYFWIATLAAQAEATAQEGKRNLELLLSELINEYREKMTDGASKAPAATIIEAAARCDRSYRRAAAVVQQQQRDASLLRVAADAFRLRHYLLLERSRRATTLQADEYHHEGV
jgi:hypothetical protein